LDREPPRGRSYPAEPYPEDDPDWGPSRDRTYRPERYPADDMDREPPPNRRHPRDDGWSWAEEER
ncbi:hypothetical protein ACIRU3_10460, partial [Streptomyces sp. NPDC101151]